MTTILIVDDSPGDARLITEYLKRAPIGRHQVIHVTRHADAVRKLGEAEIDLVLLDLGLPDSQGVEGVGRLWIIAPAVPIIVMSGSDDDGIALDCIAAGADDYVFKGTLDETELKRAVGCALGRRARIVDRANTAELRVASRTTVPGISAGPVGVKDYESIVRAYLAAIATRDPVPSAAIVELAGRLALRDTDGAGLRRLHDAALPDRPAAADSFLLLMMEALLGFNLGGVDAVERIVDAARER